MAVAKETNKAVNGTSAHTRWNLELAFFDPGVSVCRAVRLISCLSRFTNGGGSAYNTAIREDRMEIPVGTLYSALFYVEGR